VIVQGGHALTIVRTSHYNALLNHGIIANAHDCDCGFCLAPNSALPVDKQNRRAAARAISTFTRKENLAPFKGPSVCIPDLQLQITNNFKTTGTLAKSALASEQLLNNALKIRSREPDLDPSNKLVYDEGYGAHVIVGRCASKAFRFDTTSTL